MTDTNKDLTASQMLFEARTSGRRKREIATLSKLLCIREEYLIALENGDYHLIPEVVYILGFARNYAIELGLDPDEIIGKIKKELGLEEECDSTDEETQENEKEDMHPVVAAQKAKQQKEKKSKAAQTNRVLEKVSKYVYRHWKWLLAAFVALVVVVSAVIFVASLGSDKEAVNSEVVGTTTLVAPEYKQIVREKFGTENAATANVILQATQESWVKIEDARGNTVFSRVLVPGDIYYVPEGDKYKGTFGNAGGVDVWVNGKLAPKLGEAHTRKSGMPMSPSSLMPTEAQAEAE
jgi:cytoskeletal protein RodZ